MIRFSFFRDKIRLRISSTPSPSIALIGSSSRMISGLPRIAAAMPSLCFMPREYFSTFLCPASSRPTSRISCRISSSGTPPCIFAKSFKFWEASYSGRSDGFSNNNPILLGIDIFLCSCSPLITIRPLVGRISPDIARISMVLPEPFLP